MIRFPTFKLPLSLSLSLDGDKLRSGPDIMAVNDIVGEFKVWAPNLPGPSLNEIFVLFKLLLVTNE
jgi:hypothetical protein